MLPARIHRDGTGKHFFDLPVRPGLQIRRQRGHQHNVFPEIAPARNLDETQEKLAVDGALRHPGHTVAQAPAQNHHPTLPAPSREPQLPLPRAPAPARVDPTAFPGQTGHPPLHLRRHPQPEEVHQALPLRPAHVGLAATTRLAPKQHRPVLSPEPIQQRPWRGRGVPARVCVARLHRHVQHQMRPRHHGAVTGVARPTRRLRVVAHHRSLLVPVERLDRRVHVEDPGLAQQRPDNVVQMTPQPGNAPALVDLAQMPPYRVLAHDPLHAQKIRAHPVRAQAGDVGMATVARQDRQHQGPHHIALRRCVRTGQLQRAVRHQRVKQTALLHERHEKRQLAQRRHRRFRIPFHMNPTAETIHGERPLGASLFNPQGSTHRGRARSLNRSRHDQV